MIPVPRPRLRLQLLKLMWISLFWMAIAILNFLFEYEVLVNHAQVPEDFAFWRNLGVDLAGAFLGGLLGGFLVIFYLENWFRTRPYGQALFVVFLSYTLVFIFIAGLGSYFIENAGTPFPDRLRVKRLLSLDFFKSYILWLLIVLITILGSFINDKYGPGALKDFLLGRYFRPKKEYRIIMFLDLRSSTRIAEQLGEEQYFSFLKELFKDATLPILNHLGEIYQYVGDEIIITWKQEKGLKNANCVHCFLGIQEVLSKKAQHYQKNYGFKPEFKAGLHAGHVMTGEIGTVKRDITFLGDVINTTSRIQGHCNDLGVDLLLSQHLVKQLSLPPNGMQPKKVQELFLRGKRQRMVLYTI